MEDISKTQEIDFCTAPLYDHLFSKANLPVGAQLQFVGNTIYYLKSEKYDILFHATDKDLVWFLGGMTVGGCT